MRKGVNGLSVEQVRDHSPNEIASSITHYGIEVGKYIHGFYYKIAEGTKQRLHLCGGL